NIRSALPLPVMTPFRKVLAQQKLFGDKANPFLVHEIELEVVIFSSKDPFSSDPGITLGQAVRAIENIRGMLEQKLAAAAQKAGKSRPSDGFLYQNPESKGTLALMAAAQEGTGKPDLPRTGLPRERRARGREITAGLQRLRNNPQDPRWARARSVPRAPVVAQ
ncbi:MAG: hypothetical protein M3O22_08435, partial [Pseudomonadota bacterium]|nr:hypothetical protein [Pseudomonadota bacterium]